LLELDKFFHSNGYIRANAGTQRAAAAFTYIQHLSRIVAFTVSYCVAETNDFGWTSCSTKLAAFANAGINAYSSRHYISFSQNDFFIISQSKSLKHGFCYNH